MKKDADLHDKDQWDFDNAQQLPPERRPRAIVSVAFSAADFAVVSMAAEAAGMRVSTFIRDAAITKARRSEKIVRWESLQAVQTNIRFPYNVGIEGRGAVSSATRVL
jgi:hypothetical protein